MVFSQADQAHSLLPSLNSIGKADKKKNTEAYRYMSLWVWSSTRQGEDPSHLMTQTWSTQDT